MGRCSVPVKNLGFWKKRAGKLVAINWHVDLFSSAAYLCLQQESMSVTALSRLLEVVANSIRHSTAVSTILATELFQARLEAVIAISELWLENSSNKLRNAPVYAKSLFDNKEVAKANYEAQQQKFLASSSTNTNEQQQQSSYLASGVFKRPRQPNKSSRPKQSQPYRSKTQNQSFTSSTRRDYSKRSSNTKQFPSSKHSSSSTKFWKPTLSTAYLTPRYSSERKIVEQWGKLTHNKGSSLSFKTVSGYHSGQLPHFRQFFLVIMRRDCGTSPETGSGKGTRFGNSQFLFPGISCPEKEWKVTSGLDLPLLNQYIRKQPFKMETVKSVQQSILVNDWTVSIDLTDAYLHVPIHPWYRKYLQFMFKDQVFQFMALRFRMSPSPWIFTKLMDVIAAHLRQRAISLFWYLDNWLIRDLIRNRQISPTIYCLQIVQSLGFIPNLKKSDLIPAQKFTFIGMEFLTQQNIVRVPADRVDSLFLTIKLFLSQTQVLARTFVSLLDKSSATADFVLLGRLHLQGLQMCLLSVWRPHIFPLDHQVPINSMIRFHLKWWMDTNCFVQGTSIHPPDPNAFLFYRCQSL